MGIVMAMLTGWSIWQMSVMRQRELRMTTEEGVRE